MSPIYTAEILHRHATQRRKKIRKSTWLRKKYGILPALGRNSLRKCMSSAGVQGWIEIFGSGTRKSAQSYSTHASFSFDRLDWLSLTATQPTTTGSPKVRSGHCLRQIRGSTLWFQIEARAGQTSCLSPLVMLSILLILARNLLCPIDSQPGRCSSPSLLKAG